MSNPETPLPLSRRWVIWLPLVLFGAFVALVVGGLLRPADPTVRSTLVGKPLPSFHLPAALESRPGLDSRTLADGKVHLINIFASWCVPCRVEAPQLAILARAGVPIEGIAVRDDPAQLAAFLQDVGNPYHSVARDDDGQVQLAIGSSGVPETYVIDGQGVIRYQHVGEIRADDVPMILDQVQAARR